MPPVTVRTFFDYRIVHHFDLQPLPTAAQLSIPRHSVAEATTRTATGHEHGKVGDVGSHKLGCTVHEGRGVRYRGNVKVAALRGWCSRCG